MGVFLTMGICISLALTARHAAFISAARALVPTGTMLNLLTLWTGCMWHRPISGVWWAGGAEQASELGLFIACTAFLVTSLVTQGKRSCLRAGALSMILGLPAVAIQAVMMWPHGIDHLVTAMPRGTELHTFGAAMLAIATGLTAYAAAVSLARLRCILLEDQCDAASAGGTDTDAPTPTLQPQASR